MIVIEFNEKGSIKKTIINNLYQGSSNIDSLYVFSDFDTEPIGNLEATVTFRRADGNIIGPLEMSDHVVTENDYLPSEYLGKFCRKIDFVDPVTGTEGILHFTIRYEQYELIDGVLTKVKTRAVGMATTYVYGSIGVN